MLLNLSTLILVNVVFQNQQILLGNDQTTSPSNFGVVPDAIMCLHNKINDYWLKFKSSQDNFFITIIQSIQLFIFIPCLIGTFMVMSYSGKLINKYYNNMKLLLTSYDDNPPYKYLS